METKRYTPELVVSENLSFSIPLYQRLFAWGEKQVIGLLKDLLDHFSHSESPYYLGMISCILNKGRYDLIDGQQRFTVMSLMGIVLREYYPEWNAFLNGGKRVEFVARTKDKEYLAAKISGNVSIQETNVRMDLAIKAIKTFMDDSENFQSDTDKSIYAKRVFKYLSFFFSDLPHEYLNEPASLNKYFEAMNAHGKSLEQHEILKVELMKDIPDKEYLTKIWNAVSEMGRPIINKKDDAPIDEHREAYKYAIQCCRNGAFDQAFQYCISTYDNEVNDTIGDIQEEKAVPSIPFQLSENSDRSIVSFSELLLLVLDINQSLGGKYSFYRKELIPAFNEFKIDNIKSFYYELLFCRLLLDYYVISKEDGQSGNKYDVLFNQDGDFFNPKDKKSFIQYESMLYVSQTPIYEWLKPLLLRLKQNKPDSFKELLKWLKDTDNMYRKLPESVEELSYTSGVDRYWFWRLDYYLWEKQDLYFKDATDKEIVDEYVFRANRSIEHLHPQNQVNNAMWEISNVHSFGNLAMISQSFNSEQSDDPVTVKFARILDQANNHNLQSIKLYKMYLDSEKNPGGWTLERMHQHQTEMFDLLKQSFLS